MDNLLIETIESGLSEQEAKLYTSLLRSGTAGAKAAFRKAGLTPSQGEHVSLSLVQKNLVRKSVLAGKPMLTAAEPRLLQEYLEREAGRIAAMKERAVRILEPLRLLGAPAGSLPKLEYFVGPDGVRAALQDTLRAKERTLRGFLAIADLVDFIGADFFEQFTKQRVQAGITLHAIRTFERDKRGGVKYPKTRKALSSKEEKREVRYVNEDLSLPMSVFLIDQRLLAVGSRNENFAFVLESKEFVQTQKKLFDFVWRSVAIRSISG